MHIYIYFLNCNKCTGHEIFGQKMIIFFPKMRFLLNVIACVMYYERYIAISREKTCVSKS